jgi:protein-tyrosine phosphatase
MIDIHCHLLPELDDGPATWEQSLQMAQIAVDDGIRSVIATPHQLGSYHGNPASLIRARICELRERLQAAKIPLQVYAGADVRIEADLAERLRRDEVLTLAEQRRHVLLELPHELYFPLEPLLAQLKSLGITGILSHPERNRGLLSDPSCLSRLVAHGCLMQITAGSLLGGFGRASQRLAESMLAQGLVHFVASDGHGIEHRRPRLHAAYLRVVELTDRDTADNLFVRFPARVCEGLAVAIQRRSSAQPVRRWFGLARRA